MKQTETPLTWSVGMSDTATAPETFFPATVPGNALHDYAKHREWPPIHYDLTANKFPALLNKFWTYRAIVPADDLRLVLKASDPIMNNSYRLATSREV